MKENVKQPALNGGRTTRRRGRVAVLPKIERDMVNHMLCNAVPYKNIVGALDEAGYKVTERNVSNWATGGYLEWSVTQDQVLRNRLDQDHLLDFLSRDEAQAVPEVGLQAAATSLSQLLLKKLAHAEDPEAHLDSFSKLVDILVRLNREIGLCQKQRDDSQRTLGPEYDPVRVRDTEQIGALENERYYSDPPPESSLQRPAHAPMIPPVPTATLMADEARDVEEEERAARQKRNFEILKAIATKNAAEAKSIEDDSGPGAMPPDAPLSEEI